MNRIEWLQLHPDQRCTWLTENLHSEFTIFIPVGTKEAKEASEVVNETLFRTYSGGVKTNRDDWTYDFNSTALIEKMNRFIDTYNGEVDRWRRYNNSPDTVDSFVIYDDKRIKWSGDLKIHLTRGKYASYSEKNIRHSLYRPFVKQYLYFDSLLNNRVYLQPTFFPTSATEVENAVICVAGVGDRKGFGSLATNMIPSVDLAFEKAQCFPYYTYASDGTNQRENITDWALSQFQQQYGPEVSKRDIFVYVYAMLHHPQYRERYAENLKRELPRIPLLKTKEAFETCVRIGQRLMNLHLTYERVEEYPLQWVENRDVPVNWRVEKMKLTPDKSAVIVNEWLILKGVPQEAFKYRLGNRSALEWVIDQYRITTDTRSGITSDPNLLEDEEYIVRLVGRVVTVSIETVKLVEELAQKVRQEEWLGEQVEVF